MSSSSKDTGENSPRFSLQTKQEQDEAFRLLGELESESARQQALREALIQNLSQLHEPPPVHRELSPEEQAKFSQNWGAWLHPKAK
jgi:hypothetical protein